MFERIRRQNSSAALGADERGEHGAELGGVPAARARAPEALAHPQVLATAVRAPQRLSVAGADDRTLG